MSGYRPRAIVEMRFTDGTVLRTWESFSLHESFADPLGSFSFTARPTIKTLAWHTERLQKGEKVLVYVDNARQGAFIITGTDAHFDRDNGATIEVTCKTPLATAYEAGVDPTTSRKPPTDVAVTDLILAVMQPYGFLSVFGDSSANVQAMTGKPIGNRSAAVTVEALKAKDLQAHENETAYQFCARIITRLGLALRVDATDETKLLVSAPDYEQDELYAVGDGEGCDRFVHWNVVDTNDGQFSECVCRGVRHDDSTSTQSNTPKAVVNWVELMPPPAPTTTTISATARRDGFAAYSSTYHPTKPRYLHDKSARDVPRAKNAATLALGLPAKDAFVIRGEVYGMKSRTGALWASDTVARCRISLPMIRGASFDAPMWVLGKTWRMDRDGGQFTSLDLIPLGAMRLGDVGG